MLLLYHLNNRLKRRLRSLENMYFLFECLYSFWRIHEFKEWFLEYVSEDRNSTKIAIQIRFKLVQPFYFRPEQMLIKVWFSLEK